MDFALMVLGVAAVAFAVSAVIAGRGGTLAEAPADRAPWRPPSEPIDAAALAALRFPFALRGYRMDAVDAVLDEVARELTSLHEQLLEARRVGPGGPVGPVGVGPAGPAAT